MVWMTKWDGWVHPITNQNRLIFNPFTHSKNKPLNPLAESCRFSMAHPGIAQPPTFDTHLGLPISLPTMSAPNLMITIESYISYHRTECVSWQIKVIPDSSALQITFSQSSFNSTSFERAIQVRVLDFYWMKPSHVLEVAIAILQVMCLESSMNSIIPSRIFVLIPWLCCEAACDISSYSFSSKLSPRRKKNFVHIIRVSVSAFALIFQTRRRILKVISRSLRIPSEFEMICNLSFCSGVFTVGTGEIQVVMGPTILSQRFLYPSPTRVDKSIPFDFKVFCCKNNRTPSSRY